MIDMKKPGIWAGVITLFLLISVLSVGIALSREVAEEDIFLVYKRGISYDELTGIAGINILADYDEFVLVSASTRNKNLLLNQGYMVESLENRDEVFLHSHSFNTATGVPEIQSELYVDSYPMGVSRLYIVQFVGPILYEWQEQLMEMGAFPQEYRHRYNIIFEMDTETAKQIQSLDFVNWVGIYQPAFKFDNTLLDNTGSMDLEVCTVSTVDSFGLAGYLSHIGCEVELVTDGYFFVRADASQIITIANLPQVLTITPRVTDLEFLNNHATWITQTNILDDRKVTEMGVTGVGEMVTVCDSELYTTGGGHEMWYDTVDFGDDHRKVQAYYSIGGALNTGVYHGTHVAGTVLGDAPPYDEYNNRDGNAIGARMIFQDIGTANNQLSLPSDMYNQGWGRSYNEGSRSHTNSWGGGSGSAYGGLARTGDLFIWDHKDYNILFAAGNDGTGRGDGGTISQQGQGKNIITVGAVQNYNSHNSMASFSSRGYASDGRIKPTILHVGAGVSSASRSASGYSSMSGTSMSTPGMAGQVAQVQHYYAGGWYPSGVATPADGFYPSNALVRATLINGAVEITGTGAYATDTRFPNSDQGYGRSMLDRVMFFEEDSRKLIAFDSLEEGVALSTGQSWSMEFDVEDASQQLEVTLAWTDYPGANSANPAIVNDLDLELFTPSGTRYVGNAFTGSNPGYSEPDPTSNPWSGPRTGAWDGLNVDENILLIPNENGVESGVYEIKVTAHQVTQGPQPFAVVVSGGVAMADAGAPNIELTSPTGGETWNAGATESITWSATPGDGAITGIDLELSLDGGITWSYIEQGLSNDGSYSWTIPSVSTASAVIRATAHDDQGLSRRDTSGLFSIIGDAPAPPSNLQVEHYGGPGMAVLDDFSDGDYTTDPTWTVYDGDWSVEDSGGNHWLEGQGQISTPSTQAYGRWEWDFQLARIDEVSGSYQLMRFYFIQDQPQPDTSSCSGYLVTVTGDVPGGGQANLWRLDNGVPPADPLIRGSWTPNTNWNTLAVERAANNIFTLYLNGDVVGQSPADGTYTTSTHIGFRHEGPASSDRHRVSEVRTMVEMVDENNRLSWQASPDDPSSVSEYAIYRSEVSGGPWDATTLVDSVPADGSSNYEYIDFGKGMADEIYWWYVVRAMDDHGQHDGNTDAVQEPSPGEPPSVSLTRPTGDETWDAETTESIEWTASPGDGNITVVDLEYSPNGGASWSYIAQGIGNTGSHSWNIPQISTASAMIRVTVHDDNGLMGRDTSGLFSIMGDAPRPPSSLTVQHVGEGGLVVFDDFSDGDYTTDPTWTVYDGDWSVEDSGGNYWLEGIGQISTPHTQAYGAWEWDFQFIRNAGGRNNQMRFYFIQDQPEPDVDTCSGYYVIVVPNLIGDDPTINLWRLDDGEPPEEPLINGNWPGNTDWNTLRVERDDNGVFRVYLNGDMIGSPSSPDNTYTTSTHIGFRHSAGQDTDLNRVSEVRVTGTGGAGDDHNLISWQSSPDDPGSVDHYTIYRSEVSSGPWGPTTLIDSVPADGSSNYEYIDLDKGMADDIYWWYVVRAVDGHGQDDGNSNAVQEPEGTVPDTYTLTINVNGQGTTNPSAGTHTYNDGTPVTITATPASGWEFVRWEGDATGTSPSTTVTMDDDKTVTAVFEEETTPPPTYTLTINIEGQGTTNPAAGTHTYDEGDSVTITASAASGWQFARWEGDATGTSPSTTVTMDDDKTVTAVFEEEPVPEYTLTINVNGQGTTNPAEGTHTYDEGTSVTITASAASGWEFIRWEGDATGTSPSTTVTMDSDKTVTAVFEEEPVPEYTLTINVNGQGTTNPAEGTHTYDEGDSVTITASAATGWEFVRWEGDATGTSPSTTVTMNDDKTVTAVFEEIPVPEYTLTIIVDGDGSTDPAAGTHTYDEGTSVTITATPASGWEFIRWEGDATGTSPSTSVTMDSDKTVTAIFETEEVTYTLTISSTDGGQVTTPGEGTFDRIEGTVVDLVAVADDGYEFVGWTGDTDTIDDTGSATTTITMDDDYSITAEFQEIPPEMYTLTVNIVGDGTVERSPHEAEYEEGTTVTLTAVPEDGWEFVEWSGAATGTDLEVTITMDSDKTVTANFETEEVTYTLTIDSTSGGTVTTPGEDTYTRIEGTQVNLVAVADDGYEFVEWTGDTDTIDDTGSATTTITMDGDYSITAEFRAVDEPTVEYDLTITIEGQGSTNPAADTTHTYDEGETVTVTATAASGWKFVEWTGDVTGTSASITVTMDDDKSITAVFEVIDDDDDGEEPSEPGVLRRFWWILLLLILVIIIIIVLARRGKDEPTGEPEETMDEYDEEEPDEAFEYFEEDDFIEWEESDSDQDNLFPDEE